MTHSSPKVALGPFQKRSLYAVTVLLWLSGAVWLWLKYFGQVQGPFGPEPRPLQASSLKIHGAAAMAFLVALGALLPQHVRLGWRTKRQRLSGVSLLVIGVVLTLTGWGLYYVGSDDWRPSVSWVHTIVGLVLPALIAGHVWSAARRQ